MALMAALPAIEISMSDVGVSVYVRDEEVCIRLFDTFPGGAGHAVRIKERFNELCDAAYTKVKNCNCGKDTSCYSCLRSYQNQNIHESLKREAVLEFFES